jgi:hypothetical protein
MNTDYLTMVFLALVLFAFLPLAMRISDRITKRKRGPQ